MRDAFGGIVNIFLIAFLLVIIEGILGLVVNYSKAFRMKNVVISSFERYEASGHCEEGSDCFEKIVQQAKSIGYSKKNNLNCTQGFKNVGGYFCYQKSSNKSGVYTVETQVDINFPIINKIMGLSIFKVRGDTRTIRTK